MSLLARLQAARDTANTALLNARNAQGHWTGELSSSALSTATAVCALTLAEPQSPEARRLVAGGLDWLAENINADGGWGDTALSLSNISTTTLCWSAFGVVVGADEKYRSVVTRAEAWIKARAGSIAPEPLSQAIVARYGSDRTFSVPILTMAALCGRLGPPREAWARVIPLPFELAVCPPEWFAALRLPVVSYALPALIAMGIARHRHRPSFNPLARGLRHLAEGRAMSVLKDIQPSNGGFLEATPLTSFVTMSLAASGHRDHPVARKGVEFLIASARPDGSWAIDTNLATWVTTLSVNALASGGAHPLRDSEAGVVREWLLRQQYRERHPYTNAPPGGWAWTDLPGGVPDADDTPGALLALRRLGSLEEPVREAASAGVHWLLGLQNRDGGIPTFCRGWGKLPFDQSSPDLTAHTLRAWSEWLPDLPQAQQNPVRAALARARRYLAREQATSGFHRGGWRPLWFGNQHNPDENNWTYGASRVLLALAASAPEDRGIPAAVEWLVKTQLNNGSWGGGESGAHSSTEETALAVEALSAALTQNASGKAALSAVRNGAAWLASRVEDRSWTQPSPIGFYFAKLWYFERLYPVIMTVAALNRAAALEEKLSSSA